MKFDEARLEQSRREAEDRIRNFNTLTLAVIRSHLLIEQTMDIFSPRPPTYGVISSRSPCIKFSIPS